MPENRKDQNNAVENTSPDSIGESIWRLKIQSDDENQEGGDKGAQSSPYPDRPGEPDCLYFLRTGLCGYGSKCRYNHPTYTSEGDQYEGELPQRVGQPDCVYFLKTATCKYGSTCKYNHPRDRHGAAPISFNTAGLPMRQEERSCPYYIRTGFCKFGHACKFHHPQPTLNGTILPVTAATLRPTESSMLPSSGLPFGSLSTWSLPGAAYPQHGPQGYMPVVISPSPGITPPQGWNTYLGNMSPMPSTSIFGSGVAYNSRNQGDLGFNAQVNLLSTSIAHYPERPNQPECRYFLNNGTCKYGSDCKYNHPKERIAQLATHAIGPYGLPSRPGQTVCSHYNLYGLCKYGPACKFDHPLAGYSYNYGLGMPPLPMLDPSLYLPRNSSAALSPEVSPFKSSRHPDWNRKPHFASNKDRKSNAKAPADPSEHADSPSHSVQTPSEPHDQSD